MLREPVSPELVLIDPELRAALPMAPDSPFYAAHDVEATAEMEAAADVEATAEDGSHFRRSKRALAQGRRAKYALRLSLLLNLLLLLLLPGSPRWPVARPALAVSATVDHAERSSDSPPNAARPAGARSSAQATTTNAPPRRLKSPAATGARKSGRAAGTASAPRRVKPSADAGTAAPVDPATAEVQQAPNKSPTATATQDVAERHVLDSVRSNRRLQRFVDPLTTLLRPNVTVHCTPKGPAGTALRAAAFTCLVWHQPELPSTGATVLYRALPGGRFSISVLRSAH